MVALFSPPTRWLTEVTTDSDEGIADGSPWQRSANGCEDAGEGHFHEAPARWACASALPGPEGEESGTCPAICSAIRATISLA